MITFCFFVFAFYALSAIVKMLIDYTLGIPFERGRKHRGRKNIYEKTDSGFRVTQTQRADKAYF